MDSFTKHILNNPNIGRSGRFVKKRKANGEIKNKKEDFIEQQNQKIEKPKKTNRLKSQWDRLTR